MRIASDEHGYVDPLAFLPGRAASPPPAEPAAGSAAPKSGGKAASADRSAKTATAGEKRVAPEPRATGRAKPERHPAVHTLTRRAPPRGGSGHRERGREAKCGAGGAVAAASGARACVRDRGERVGARRTGAPLGGDVGAARRPVRIGRAGRGSTQTGPRRSRRTPRAHGVRAGRLLHRRTQGSGRASMITSSWTEISSGSFSPRPMRFRISIGITIRPRSSTWRTMPVVFWWACEEAARNAARAPIVVVGRPSRLARFR